MMDNEILAKELFEIASVLTADSDYEYIYDPDHKKHPGGGYTKTEKGWQKGKKEEEKSESGNSGKSVDEELVYNQNNHFEVSEQVEKITDPDKLDKLSNHSSFFVRKFVANNPNTSKETLAKLAKDENYNVRVVVALNKNTPEKSQIDLCGDENIVVKECIAMMKLPKEGVAKLLKDDDARVRAALAGSENALPEALAVLGNDKKKIVLEKVATNKNTPSETLENLAKRKDPDIRAAVADNKNASSAVLSYMYDRIPYDDMETYGRCAKNIAFNGNTSPEVLEDLFGEADSFGKWALDVKDNVAHNTNTPGSILEKCLKSDSNMVRESANFTCQKKYNNESVYLDEEGQEYFLDQLEEEYDNQKKDGNTEAQNFDEYLDEITSGDGSLHKLEYKKAEKKEEPKQTQTPSKPKKTMKDVVDGLDFEKKKQICSDQQAPSKILDILSNDKDANIRAFVSLNKNTSVDTLNKLSKDKDVHVRNMLMYNPNCPVDLLKAGAESESTTAKMGVALNPSTPMELYAKLSKDSDYTVNATAKKEWKKKRQKDMTDEQKKIDDEADNKYGWDSYKLGAAMNTKAHPETLNMLSYDSNPEVRGRVGENKTTPVEILERLSKDPDSNVRDWIAYNPNCPDHILETLSNDSNKTVSGVAKMMLEARKQKSQITEQKADKLPKFKFKGDDKTAPIIRNKFEKEQDKEETDTIYGEMAKFSKEDVAPMGVYHGRTKEQLKADFIKNMNPANYSSPEAFQNAKARVQKLSANDFSRMLASIFADDEEETEEVK